MKLKYLFVILSLSICIPQVYGQWDAQISQYWRAKTYYNPSFAGEINDLQAVAMYKQQWVGIKHAPKTFYIAADMPIKFLNRVHGVGIGITTESIGLFSNKSFGAQYVYKKKIKKGTLNIGAQVAFVNVGFDAGGIILTEQGIDDEAMPSDVDQSNIFDGNIGVSWVHSKYYVGISMTHALAPKFDIGESRSAAIPRAYYLTGGYNITFENSLYELQPSVFVRSDGILTQYDVTARVEYNKMFNGGLTWRKDIGFVFMLGFKYKGVDAGYAYDLSTSAISQVSSGSHEIFLRFTTPIKLSKGEKKGTKSIRIL